MTVREYQRIQEIQATTLDDIDRVALIVCELFNLSAEYVDNLSSLKFLKYADKATKLLQAKEPFFNQIRIETDASKITLGQFIECITWLKNDVAQSLHLLAASLTFNFKNFDHQYRANIFLDVPAGAIVNQVNTFVQSFEALILSYKGLFEVEDQEEEPEKPHPFIDQFGWIFSAKQVAEHEVITLDKSFDLPIIQALNVLCYLKSKQSYDKWQSK